MDDAVISDRLANRDQTALRELKSKYGRLIASVCRSVLKSPQHIQDIEEVENDVLYALWEGIPRDNPENLTAYICRIARRKAVDKLRYNTAAARNSDLLTELDECLPSEFSLESAAEAAELSEALNAWLKSLDKRQQKLFTLRYFYMYSTKDAARECSMSRTAATSALMRLRGSLKKYLTERGFLYE